MRLTDQLRALARSEHDDHSIAVDAADEIDDLQTDLAEMREWVAGQRCTERTGDTRCVNGDHCGMVPGDDVPCTDYEARECGCSDYRAEDCGSCEPCRARARLKGGEG